MFRPMQRIVLTLAVAGGLLLLAPLFKAINVGGVAWAQAQNQFNSEYFDLSAGGSTVSIINPLAEPPVECALIYVFRNDEQQEECCGCPVTNSSGLRTIRVATQLTATGFTPNPSSDTLTDNPFDGQFISRGVIKILASAPNGGHSAAANNGCDPTLAPVTPLLNGLREYGTAVQVSQFSTSPPPPGTGGISNASFKAVSEHVFLGAPDPIASGEDADLVNFCHAHVSFGSDQGVCSCGKGDFTTH